LRNPFRALLTLSRKMRKGQRAAGRIAKNLLKGLPSAPKAKPRVTKAAPRTTRPTLRGAPATFLDGRFSGAEGTLDYKLYTPPGSSRRKLPLVVMLHGCGQTAADFASGTAMNAWAEKAGVLVLYPQQSTLANVGRCWNWHRPDNQQRGRGEPAKIAALTRLVARDCKADISRIYVAGLSAGAAAAAILGAAYPDLYAAVGIHSGLTHDDVRNIPGALAAMRNGGALAKPSPGVGAPPPTIVFHGDKDEVVNPLNAANFLDRLRQSQPEPLKERGETGRSAGGREFTRTEYGYARGPTLLENWQVHGSGHAWSGGKPSGSYTDPKGPDASGEMLRFFLAHKRKASRAPASVGG